MVIAQVTSAALTVWHTALLEGSLPRQQAAAIMARYPHKHPWDERDEIVRILDDSHAMNSLSATHTKAWQSHSISQNRICWGLEINQTSLILQNKP